MSLKQILPAIMLLTLVIIVSLSACGVGGVDEALQLPSEKEIAAAAKRVQAVPEPAPAEVNEETHPEEALEEETYHVEEADVDGSDEHVEEGHVEGAPEFVPPEPVMLDLDAAALAFAMGDPDAPVQIVEFTDYQCPFCGRHAFETMPDIVETLVETDRVFYAIKDLPLDAIHPEARSASVAARCAGEQDAYLPMHDAIFTAQAEWRGTGEQSVEIFAGLANDLELDVEPFETCMADGSQAEGVQANFEEAMALNVNSTPFFFLNGYAVSGAQPFELFEMAVELAESGELEATVEAQARQAYEMMLAQQAAAQQEAAAQQAAEPPQAAEPAAVSLDGAYAVGDPDAPVTIVEYTDYQCPFCARHALQTYSQIAEEMVETGQVRYVFKDMPLTSIHPQATVAAEAARCAGAQEQDAFIAMHDLLFEQQKAWSGRGNAAELFAGYAVEIGLDGDSFATCLEEHEFETAVQADMQEAAELGINGTPAFVINGQPVFGALPFEVFEEAVDSFTAEAQGQTASN